MKNHVVIPVYVYREDPAAKAQYEELQNMNIDSPVPTPSKEVGEGSFDPRTVAFKYAGIEEEGCIIVFVSALTLTTPLSVRDVDKAFDDFYMEQDKLALREIQGDA